MKAFLDTNGTQATLTAPNASQSNSFAERRFRQLMAAARASMAAAPHMPNNMWSFAVLDAAAKQNYLATSKSGKLEDSPNSFIKGVCKDAKILSPAALLMKLGSSTTLG